MFGRLTALAFLLVSGTSAHAVTLFSDDFESRTLGGLNGQNPWGTDIAAWNVVSDPVKVYGKGVQMNTDGFTSGSEYAYPILSPVHAVNTSPSSTTFQIVVSADFYIEAGTFTTNGLGQSASRRYGFGIWTPSFSEIAQAQVDTLGRLSITGSGANQVVAATVPIDQTFNFKLALNYKTGLASAYINNSQVGPSVIFNTALTSISDADLKMSRFVPLNTTLTGKGFADNYRLEAVPEPASMLALGVGALALVRRKRETK